ncbi:GNAT family N-acetyltransferase [Hydrogenophaga sp.]|uniref:GNAT family N-acetyltransferase n=1 Tax=Hydrogenophaga sp. TaxID=1904254 RepID=UPI00286DB3E9|nr:GNAT family N-acetyltransferase [Hydrogenophaga sp.]
MSGGSAVGGGVDSTVRVRFKYQFGEWVLADWRPALLTLRPPGDGDADAQWPELAGLDAAALPADVAGYQVRRTAVQRFARGLSRQGDWLCYSPRQERLYVVDIAGGFDEYLQRRSAKSRQNLKRSVKRFLEGNPDALQVVTGAEEMPAFHREAVAISRQTYQTQLLGAGLPDTPAFLQAMQDKATRGEARGYLLRDQGRAVAFAWCAARGQTLVYEVIGYRPEQADRSPGTVLLYLILEDLFALGRYPLLDFGPGHAFYKDAFATRHTDFADAYLLRATWGHRWRLWLHGRVERFSDAVGHRLERYGLKKRIRLAMRSLASVWRRTPPDAGAGT